MKPHAGMAVLLAAAGMLALNVPAAAKPARCFTTDEGHYPCDFQSLDPDGSFEISAPGYPTFQLWMDQPGVATGFINLGDRQILLPGFYVREEADPACWANADTNTRICAW